MGFLKSFKKLIKDNLNSKVKTISITTGSMIKHWIFAGIGILIGLLLGNVSVVIPSVIYGLGATGLWADVVVRSAFGKPRNEEEELTQKT